MSSRIQPAGELRQRQPIEKKPPLGEQRSQLRTDPEKAKEWRDRSQRNLRKRRRRRRREMPPSPVSQKHDVCWLAQFDPDGRPCKGRLQRCHLIFEQWLEQLGFSVAARWARCWWVIGCEAHNTRFDNGARRADAATFVVPRRCLPVEFECAVEQHPETARYADLRFGPREAEEVAA